jgi:hypothetical protein
VVCPECGLPGVPILYGYPSEQGMAEVAAGRLVLGGCVVGPGLDEFACPGQHRWRGRGRVPETSEWGEASRRYAAGDLAGAEDEFRAALAASARLRGERDHRTLMLRHALTIVLSAAGRAEEADAVHEPLRAVQRQSLLARIDALTRWRRSGPAPPPPRRRAGR